MALTKAEEEVISSHRKVYGDKHAEVMRREMEKGKAQAQAHEIALRGS